MKTSPKSKDTKQLMEPTCCGECFYCQDIGNGSECWVDGPYETDEAPHWARGKHVDTKWPMCKDFKPKAKVN